MVVQVGEDGLCIDLRAAVGQRVRALGKAQLAVDDAVAQGLLGKAIDRHHRLAVGQMQRHGEVAIGRTRHRHGRIGTDRPCALPRGAPGRCGAFTACQGLQTSIKKPRRA